MTKSSETPVKALLAHWRDVPANLGPAFRRWCDEEELPAIRKLPGFLGAARFEAVEGKPSDLGLGELGSPGALESAAVREREKESTSSLRSALREAWLDEALGGYRLRFFHSPNNHKRIDAPALLVVRMFTKPGQDQLFREWLDGEHALRQMQVPGARSYFGFEPVSGPFHFLNVFAVDDPSVITSEAWEAARNTEWRERAHQAIATRLRTVYRRA